MKIKYFLQETLILRGTYLTLWKFKGFMLDRMMLKKKGWMDNYSISTWRIILLKGKNLFRWSNCFNKADCKIFRCIVRKKIAS